MTDEELKKALHWCGEDTCSGCPLEKYYPARCRLYLTSEAYGRISLLESENAALRERLSKAVELPVKIGDKIYMPWVYGGESGIAECEVYHIALFKDKNDRILIVTDLKSDNIDFKREYNYGQFMLRDFGVKLFTTPEAALARLAELKGG